MSAIIIESSVHGSAYIYAGASGFQGACLSMRMVHIIFIHYPFIVDKYENKRIHDHAYATHISNIL